MSSKLQTAFRNFILIAVRSETQIRLTIKYQMLLILSLLLYILVYNDEVIRDDLSESEKFNWYTYECTIENAMIIRKFHILQLERVAVKIDTIYQYDLSRQNTHLKFILFINEKIVLLHLSAFSFNNFAFTLILLLHS